MRRVSFRLPAEEKEELLDALMPLLPAGVRERSLDGGDVELATTAAAPPSRGVLEAAVGAPLAGWREEEVPDDWRERRALFGGGGFLVADRVLVRSPWDPPAEPGVLDVVLERGGGGFGSGSHATTRMCLELLLELEPSGGAADLGCGLGTLAIAAARLGWAPVIAVDRMEGAVEAARENGARNDVEVDWRVADLESTGVPLAAALLVNAPPPVHARVAAALRAAGESVAGAPTTGGPAATVTPGGSEAGLPAALTPGRSEAGSAAAVTAGGSEAGWAAAAIPGGSEAGSAATASSPAATRDFGAPRHLIVSGVVPTELDEVASDYASAGWHVVATREEDGWSAALLEPRDV